MKRRLTILAVMVLFAPCLWAQNPTDNTLAGLAEEILQNLQSFYPVVSTGKGIHTYDYLFTDYSSKSIRAEVGKLKKFQSRLNQFKSNLLSPEGQIDWKLLKSNVDIALQNLERIKWHVRNPYIYVDDAVTGTYLILNSPYAPFEQRGQNIIARWKLVPDLLAQAKLNLKKPAPVYIKLAHEMAYTGVEFYKKAAEELKFQLPDLTGEIDAAVQRAIAAMQDYQKFLQNLPSGDPNAFAIGKTEFDFKLKNEYFLDYDSDSLIKIGENLLAVTDSLYKAYELFLEANPVPVDSVFAIDCLSKYDVLNYYNWEIEQTKLYLREHDVLTVPDNIGACIAVETPVFMRNITGGIAYQPPGTFNSDQTGYFYVRPIPDSLDEGQREARYRYILRRGFKGSVVHEGYPGHHMQFMMSARIPSSVRKWQENNCYIEGWALYCEQMMYDNGFYGSDKRPYLGVLGGIMFRAARIVVDAKLHTGKMSTDEAVQWMSKALDSDSQFIRTEVNRYTLTPTIPMSYLIGKTEVMKLRDAFKAREGDKFSMKDFHDKYLSEGMVPPRLLWEIWNLK
ncbi:MAG: DUF885 domain-containing protein [candidate division Zixibacteria bacterium]|nr:DUF885 domain-containing protein [candidate division Zixibacteria bacterium]